MNNGITGEVILEVEVFKDGSIGEVNVLKSLQAGPDECDESAIKAMRQWIFEPAKAGNKPVASWVTIPVEFRLK